MPIPSWSTSTPFPPSCPPRPSSSSRAGRKKRRSDGDPCISMNDSPLPPAKALRAVVLCPVLRDAPAGPRSAGARLEEAAGLAQAIDLVVVHREVVRLSQLRPSTLLGSGAVARLQALIAAEEIGLAVVDWGLTPVQQR